MTRLKNYCWGNNNASSYNSGHSPQRTPFQSDPPFPHHWQHTFLTNRRAALTPVTWTPGMPSCCLCQLSPGLRPAGHHTLSREPRHNPARIPHDCRGAIPEPEVWCSCSTLLGGRNCYSLRCQG